MDKITEQKQYNKLVKKLANTPDDITDEEMDIFLSAMKTESDSNIMRHFNPNA